MDIALLATLVRFLDLFLSGAPEEGLIAPGSRIPHGHLANERFAGKILRLVSMAILSRTVFRLRILAGNDGRGENFVLGSLSLNVDPENWRHISLRFGYIVYPESHKAYLILLVYLKSLHIACRMVHPFEWFQKI